MIAGGDLCRKELLNSWKDKLDFYNEYGPTETTVTAIEYKAEPGTSINNTLVPIGRPVANVSIYIVDKN